MALRAVSGRVWPWLIGAALAAFGSTSISIGAGNALLPEQSQDLAPVYKAARLWLAGADPYAPMAIDAWRARTHAADPPDAPTGPDQSTIYSPIAVMTVAAFSSPSWRTSTRLWLGLNLALVAYVPWLLVRLWYRSWPPALAWPAAGLWMGGMGLRIGLGNGQHALLWLSLILTSCALWRTWPRTAGVVLALSLHKFNLTAVMAPYFVARRAFRVLVVAAIAAAALLVVFFAWSQAPAPEIITSYVREFSWLFGQSHGGTLPGRGVTDVYSIVAGVIGDGRVASALSFTLGAAGLVVTFLATSDAASEPRDVDIAAWFLLLLWTTYHRAYDTVLFAVPLAVLIDRAWRAVNAPRTWGAAVVVAALSLMWYADPSKLFLIAHPAPLDRIPETGAMLVIETIYRLGVLFVWAYLVRLAARERGVAREALAVQASRSGSDKTPGGVCADGRLLRVAGFGAEGVSA